MKTLFLLIITFLLASSFSSNEEIKKEAQIKVIFLDVNETILDLNNMRTSVAKALDGRSDLLDLWFSKMLHYSLVASDINRYEHFGTIGVATLMMVAESHHINLTKEDAKKAIITPLRSLPAHPDVKEGLRILKSKGYRVITLTNSSFEGVKTQMDNADLTSYLDGMLSIEAIKVYKPHLDSYKWALKQAGVKPEEALMVAAHGWDIAGAQEAGLKTAFIARPGKVLYPLVEKPTYEVNDLIQLATLLKDQSQAMN
ncbi:haloacid dehalogenase type II [Flammeovirga kamogawensis]|uniref:Haloacid dehalogenase type II n=1 Tax=Flammeovirga kamogawensis TaxID=373891 RepID=A0ABX8H493_9BACT|nr:haloacid dehalogenase type II [Flammeovirga kamogawensis]MBB6461804.1 2-haloacid dehalogenase [Flammeovirga kamogawensis]QWG10720.1 haloacid dehalogenase type II [Flammeovirga kamogawensis]TRX63822.1 haloacid dehalogenase type II [Flammeovirga kamogawensis]